MDIFALVCSRLDFVLRFYDAASHPFLETKEKIERGEYPYAPRDIESGEPEYDSEWGEADDSLDVLGHCCISLIHQTLFAYLRAFALHMHTTYPTVFPEISSKLTKQKRDQGTLEMYRRVFLDEFHIDLEKWLPVTTSVLEELIWTRNDFQHNKD